MKESLTDITLLLDRTGSMEQIASDVVGGINTFIKGQKKAEGHATFTFIQFDSVDPQEMIYTSLPIERVTPMRRKDFIPRAQTPLLDAMGMAITSAASRISAIAEDARPGKVVFVVFTDGLENASREYSYAHIKDLVEGKERDAGWAFIFLGATMDAFDQHALLGTAMVRSGMSANARSSFGATSDNVSRYRKSGARTDLAYSEQQRRKMGGKA